MNSDEDIVPGTPPEDRPDTGQELMKEMKRLKVDQKRDKPNEKESPKSLSEGYGSGTDLMPGD
jgi:hypothetical protein